MHYAVVRHNLRHHSSRLRRPHSNSSDEAISCLDRSGVEYLVKTLCRVYSPAPRHKSKLYAGELIFEAAMNPRAISARAPQKETIKDPAWTFGRGRIYPA